MESFGSAKPSKCWSFRFYGNDFYNRWRKSSTFYVFVTIGIVFSDLRIVCIILNIYWNKFPLQVSPSKFFHYLYLLLRISLSDYRSLNYSWLHYYIIVIKMYGSFLKSKKKKRKNNNLRRISPPLFCTFYFPYYIQCTDTKIILSGLSLRIGMCMIQNVNLLALLIE